MSTIKEKAKNFKQSIKQNGVKTEIRRIKNYIKYKKTVLDEYDEWIELNEIKESFAKENVNKFNYKYTLIVDSNEDIEKFQNQIYSNYDVISIKPSNYYEKLKNIESDFCVFVGKNIRLLSICLFAMSDFIQYNECNLIYADNDFINKEGKRVNPDFKPHFAYDNILSKNYIGNFIAIKTKFLIKNIDILKNLSDEEAIYNILLRVVAKTNRIMHIDTVLYSKEKDFVNEEEQIKIIKEFLDNKKIEYDKISKGLFDGQYKIDYKIKDNPKISIVIPNMDHLEDLNKAVDSILKKSTYKNFEIIIVENNSKNKETFDYYEKIQKEDDRVKVENFIINGFNYSKIVNYGVEKSSGEYVILLNNDIEVISNDWIEQMLMYAQRKDIGIVGAKLYFSDKTIQHAGVTVGIRGLAGHKYRLVSENQYTKDDSINYVQDLSAVTAACCMIKKKNYEKLLGFDEKLAVAFNDVDFCMKVRKEKLLIVYNPFVELFHYESKSRGQDDSKEKQKRFAKEYELFVKRWRHAIAKGDPYYSLNYRLDNDIPTINYNKIKK